MKGTAIAKHIGVQKGFAGCFSIRKRLAINTLLAEAHALVYFAQRRYIGPHGNIAFNFYLSQVKAGIPKIEAEIKLEKVDPKRRFLLSLLADLFSSLVDRYEVRAGR